MSGLFGFWLSCLSSCLAVTYTLQGNPIYFLVCQVELAEIMLWSVISALPGGRKEQAFVYYSLKKVYTTAPQHLAHGKSAHKHPCPVGTAVLSSPHQETPGGKPISDTLPPGWEQWQSSQDESALFIWQVLNSCCCILGPDVL